MTTTVDAPSVFDVPETSAYYVLATRLRALQRGASNQDASTMNDEFNVAESKDGSGGVEHGVRAGGAVEEQASPSSAVPFSGEEKEEEPRKKTRSASSTGIDLFSDSSSDGGGVERLYVSDAEGGIGAVQSKFQDSDGGESKEESEDVVATTIAEGYEDDEDGKRGDDDSGGNGNGNGNESDGGELVEEARGVEESKSGGSSLADEDDGHFGEDEIDDGFGEEGVDDKIVEEAKSDSSRPADDFGNVMENNGFGAGEGTAEAVAETERETASVTATAAETRLASSSSSSSSGDFDEIEDDDFEEEEDGVTGPGLGSGTHAGARADERASATLASSLKAESSVSDDDFEDDDFEEEEGEDPKSVKGDKEEDRASGGREASKAGGDYIADDGDFGDDFDDDDDDFEDDDFEKDEDEEAKEEGETQAQAQAQAIETKPGALDSASSFGSFDEDDEFNEGEDRKEENNQSNAKSGHESGVRSQVSPASSYGGDSFEDEA